MSDRHRDTRLCASIALQPDLLEAIRVHLDVHELGGAGSASSGLLRDDVAARGDARAGCVSKLLAAVEVTGYEQSPECALLPDHGVRIAGVAAGGGHVGSLILGLGEGPDAGGARAVLKDAARAAHGEAPAAAPATC